MKIPFHVKRKGEDHFYCKQCEAHLPSDAFYESSIRGKFRRCKKCQSRENCLRYSRKNNIFKKHLRTLRRNFGTMEGRDLLEESDVKLVINFWKRKRRLDEKNSALVPWDLDGKLEPHNLMLATKKEARILRRDSQRFRRLFKKEVIVKFLKEFEAYFERKVGN